MCAWTLLPPKLLSREERRGSGQFYWLVGRHRGARAGLLAERLNNNVRFFSLKSLEWKIACDMANSKAGTALTTRKRERKAAKQLWLLLGGGS
jgi:hypothetical protein